MTITTTRLYQLIADKTDKDTAEALTSYIDQKIKEDLDLGKFATKSDISELKAELKVDVANAKTSVAWLMLAYWVTQIAAVAYIIYSKS